MKKKLSVLDRVFDFLTAHSFPYFKGILNFLWRFTIIYAGITKLIYLVAVFKNETEFTSKSLLSLLSYIIGAVLFGLMFSLWDKRDLERETEKNPTNSKVE